MCTSEGNLLELVLSTLWVSVVVCCCGSRNSLSHLSGPEVFSLNVLIAFVKNYRAPCFKISLKVWDVTQWLSHLRKKMESGKRKRRVFNVCACLHQKSYRLTLLYFQISYSPPMPVQRLLMTHS